MGITLNWSYALKQKNSRTLWNLKDLEMLFNFDAPGQEHYRGVYQQKAMLFVAFKHIFIQTQIQFPAPHKPQYTGNKNRFCKTISQNRMDTIASKKMFVNRNSVKIILKFCQAIIGSPYSSPSPIRARFVSLKGTRPTLTSSSALSQTVDVLALSI